jgi:tetratricopeptide (TPR) repeat protein
LFTTQLAEGEAALLAGDAAAATEAFTLALGVRPDSDAAQQGLQRAEVLDQVVQLLAAGRERQAAADFDAARARFQEAKTLDPANGEIDAALQQLEAAIAENAYATAMSRGYAALQANQPAAAEEAFRDAGALRPGSSEVETALQQARDAATTARIKVHIDAASGFEAQENWATALREWQSAIAVDPNLVVAQQGLQRSQNRRDLDVFFETVIREPLRLVDETIYNQTQQLLRDLQAFEPKSPRLADQYTRVEALLSQARVPVTVQLTSDGVTEVNLLRVSALGTFTTHTQDLLPGNYVAVGLRPGYRDVRVEFTVNLGTAPAPVSVICTDKI